jgi:hypothetical protein
MQVIFPNTYEESREIFLKSFSIIQGKWPQAELKKEFISESEDLSIDWIHAQPTEEKKQVLIINTGLHGVEGYAGSGMLQLFINEFLERLDHRMTGLLLVHAINPWGMKNIRRVNPNYVDLNRNFMEVKSDFQVDFNPAYNNFDTLLNPNRPLKPAWLEFPGLISRIIINLLRFGLKDIRGAVMLGQQSYPEGLYFSGTEYQPETQVMMPLLEECLTTYKKVVQIDIHTGYGPRYQMSLVNSPNEERTQKQMETSFQYPLVVKANPEDFYSMKGDMVDWVYRLKKTSYPQVDYYGTAFEFGVYGDGLINEIKSIKTMIFENQAFRNGTTLKRTESQIKQELFEMYLPDEDQWKEKALADCRQAYSGILRAEKFI